MAQFRIPQRWFQLLLLALMTVSFFTVLTMTRNFYNKETKKVIIEKNLEKLFENFKVKAQKEKEAAEIEESLADLVVDNDDPDITWKIVAYYPPQDDENIREEMYCGSYHCKFQTDVTNLSTAVAVIVDGFLLSQAKDRIKPVRSSPDQVWIFHSKEPWSSYSEDFPHGEWNSIFNWTFTYHLNSHFLLAGPGVVRVAGNYQALWGLKMKRKTKPVLWITNQCQTDSRREDYVTELKKYIQVDIMGDCGNQKCSDDDTKPSCYDDYYFVLAFEKSLCKDYVTNEFYKTFKHPIVPIVRGGANYTRLFNKNLFINTADFYNPKHLAEHLTVLMQNRKAYEEYLKTKVNYVMMERTHNLCILCSHLHHINEVRFSYRNIAQWMDTCRQPYDVVF